MIKNAQNIYNDKDVEFAHIDELNNISNADYGIVSGIFIVKMQYN